MLCVTGTPVLSMGTNTDRPRSSPTRLHASEFVLRSTCVRRMKTASGCCSTNGCTPKYRDGVDSAANTEDRPINPALPTSNDEDFRKFLRLIMKTLPFQCHATPLFSIFEIQADDFCQCYMRGQRNISSV